MRKILILSSILLAGCEINDFLTIDFEAALPNATNPFLVDEELTAETVAQLNNSNIVFAGQYQNTNQWYVGIRKITGETLTHDLDYTLYHPVGSFSNKIVLYNSTSRSVTVYDQNLEWDESYQADTEAYATGHNKITWSEGDNLQHLSSTTGYQTSSLTDPDGGIITYPQNPTDIIHTASYTFVAVKVTEPVSPFGITNHIVKYNQAFEFIASYPVNGALAYANDNNFYTRNGSTLYQYSGDGEFIKTITNFSIPNASFVEDIKLLEDGNLAVVYRGGLDHRELKTLTVDTRQEVWSLPLGEGERAWAFDIAPNGQLLVDTYTSGFGQGNFFKIFLVNGDE